MNVPVQPNYARGIPQRSPATPRRGPPGPGALITPLVLWFPQCLNKLFPTDTIFFRN